MNGLDHLLQSGWLRRVSFIVDTRRCGVRWTVIVIGYHRTGGFRSRGAPPPPCRQSRRFTMKNYALFVSAAMLVLAGCGSSDSKPPPENSKVQPHRMDFNIDRCYPYVVPKDYLKQQPDDGDGLVRALGHDLFVFLVQEHHGVVSNVTPNALTDAGLTAKMAHERALANLEELFSSGAIKATKYDEGPQDRAFILVGGHWAAATCLLLPRLRLFAQKNLGQDEILASIPHRDVMLLFPRPANGELAAIRKFVVEHESNGLKPLTFEPFELKETGPAPVLMLP